MSDDNTLPIPGENQFLKELNIKLPEPIYLDENAELDKVKKADMELFNATLHVLYGMWGGVRSFSAAMQMIDKTLMMIEKRRAILGYSYGAAQNSNSRTIPLEPLS